MSDDSVDQMIALLKAEEWLRVYAESLYITVDELLAWADDYLESGWEQGHLENVTTDPDFWDHYDALRGVKALRRGNFFSCSIC